MLQTASAEMKLPIGMWNINANGQIGELNIAKVSSNGQITGTVHWLGSEPYTTKIFGFWDKVAWKIMFLKENTAVFDKPREPLSCNTVHPTTKEPCHGRDQVFTGYMFGGSPKGGPMKPITIAGSFEAFGVLLVLVQQQIEMSLAGVRLIKVTYADLTRTNFNDECYNHGKYTKYNKIKS